MTDDLDESVDPGEATETVGSDDGVETVRSDDVETVETVASGEATETVDSDDVAETVDSNEAAESVDSDDVAETVDSDEAAESVDSDGVVSGASQRWLLVVLVIAVLAAGGAVAWGFQQQGRADDAEAEVDERRDAALVASGFVQALLSYDHEDLDAQQAAVERFATTKFRDEYEVAFTDDVRDQIVEERASSTVTIDDVFLTVEDDDEVAALVIARSEVTSDLGASAQIESFLRLRMLRIDGRWQVDDLTSLGSRDRASPVAPPTVDDAGQDDTP